MEHRPHSDDRNGANMQVMIRVHVPFKRGEDTKAVTPIQAARVAIGSALQSELRTACNSATDTVGRLPQGLHDDLLIGTNSLSSRGFRSAEALDNGGVLRLQFGVPGRGYGTRGTEDWRPWALVINPRGTPQQYNFRDCGLACMLCARDVVYKGAGQVHRGEGDGDLWRDPGGVPPPGYRCTPFSYNGADLVAQLRQVALLELWMGRLLLRAPDEWAADRPRCPPQELEGEIEYPEWVVRRPTGV